MTNTAFCSVIFPANLPYFSDYLDSLEKQTDLDFDVLIFNDGVEKIENYFKNRSLKYSVISTQGSITNSRNQVFAYLKKSNYKNVIFGDTDDYFSENRVKESKKLLEIYDIVAHDLILVSQDKKIISELFWKNRTELKQPISLNAIKKYNFLGLGNTAINIKILPDEIKFNSNLIAVDWYLFSVILQSKVKVIFSSEAHVFYRQHEANTVGRKALTYIDFKKGVDVKLNHYRTLASINSDYSDLANQFEAFKSILTEDYFNSIQKKQKIKNPFWWEEIQI
jgi:hypothetical protein